MFIYINSPFYDSVDSNVLEEHIVYEVKILVYNSKAFFKYLFFGLF